MLRAQLTSLTPLQRRWFTVAFISAAVTVINALYLVFAGHVLDVGQDPEVLPVTYQLMLVVHICGGIVAFLAALAFVAVHLPRMIRNRRPYMRLSGLTMPALWVALMASGLFILTAANSRENHWMFVSHQIAAVLLLAGFLAHRYLSRDPPTTSGTVRASILAGISLVVLWGVHFAESGGLAPSPAQAAQLPESTARAGAAVIPEGLVPFRPLGDPDPQSPLFPSKTSTTA